MKKQVSYDIAERDGHMDILGSESFDKLLSPNPPRAQSGFVNGNKRSRHGGVPRNWLLHSALLEI